jgi:predicted peptidase
MAIPMMLAIALTSSPDLSGAGPSLPDRNRLKREIRKRVEIEYLVHLPAEYAAAPERHWPAILFLHGAGERAEPSERLLALGPLAYARTHPDFPFLVIAPHCSMHEAWSPDALGALLDEVQERYRVDKDRLYLTGFSMGGWGTWQLAMEMPQRFAAIAPLCGRVIPLLAFRLWKTPVWAFHGGRDEVVDRGHSEEMVETLRGMGDGVDVRLTIYPEAGHEIWPETYNNPELYAWFLKHALPREKSDGGTQ